MRQGRDRDKETIREEESRSLGDRGEGVTLSREE